MTASPSGGYRARERWKHFPFVLFAGCQHLRDILHPNAVMRLSSPGAVCRVTITARRALAWLGLVGLVSANSTANRKIYHDHSIASSSQPCRRHQRSDLRHGRRSQDRHARRTFGGDLIFLQCFLQKNLYRSARRQDHAREVVCLQI